MLFEGLLSGAWEASPEIMRHMGQGLAPTEVFLIPLLAQRQTGDLAGARDTLARWPQADIDECRRVASEMASGVGPVTGIASEIMTLLP